MAHAPRVLIGSLALAAAAVSPPGCRGGGEPQLSLTLYENGAFVRQTRSVAPDADGRVEIPGVPALLDPYSVRVAAPGGQPLAVLEQNYEYDLPSTGILLDRAVGRQVEAVFPDGSRLAGRLLSFDYGTTTHELARSESRRVHAIPGSTDKIYPWRDDNDWWDKMLLEDRADVLDEYWCRVLIQPADGPMRLVHVGDLADLRLSGLPEGLRAQPALSWRIDGFGRAARPLEVSYITGGLSWSAEYQLRVDPSFARGEFSGRACISNRSGAGFRDARVKLVAGHVELHPRRVSPRIVSIPLKRVHRKVHFFLCFYRRGLEGRSGGSYGGRSVKTRSHFEYHLYELPEPISLADEATKRMDLFPVARGVGLKSRLIFNSIAGRPTGVDAPNRPVCWETELANTETGGLGRALPKGSVKIVTPGPRGEDIPLRDVWIDQTPIGEKIRLDLGPAAGLDGRYLELVQWQGRTGRGLWTWELVNRTPAHAEVTIVWHPHRGLARESLKLEPALPVKRPDGETMEFTATVPAGGRRSLRAEAVISKGESE